VPRQGHRAPPRYHVAHTQLPFLLTFRSRVLPCPSLSPYPRPPLHDTSTWPSRSHAWHIPTVLKSNCISDSSVFLPPFCYVFGMSEIFMQRRNGEELARCSAQVGGSGTTHPCHHAALQPPFRERCRDHIPHTVVPSFPAIGMRDGCSGGKRARHTSVNFRARRQQFLRSTHTELAAHQPPHLPQPSHVQLDPPHTHLFPSKSDPYLRAPPTADGSIAATRTLAPHTPTLSELLLCPRALVSYKPHTHSRGRCCAHEHIHLTASQPAFSVTWLPLCLRT
jgi:hypothetical protein